MPPGCKDGLSAADPGGRAGGTRAAKSRTEQLERNFAALSLEMTEAQQARLDAARAVPRLNPYFTFNLPREMPCSGMQVA